MLVHRKFPDVLRKYTFNRYLSGLLFVILTIIALFRALQQYYLVATNQNSLWWHIPFNLFLWWSWFLLIPIIYWIMVNLKSASLKFSYWIVVYLILPTIVIIIHQAVASSITLAVLSTYPDYPSVFLKRTLGNPWIWLDFVTFYGIMIGIRIVEYQQRSSQIELKFTQFQARLAQSQLHALTSQLRPHFLFNTLNSISTAIVLGENNEAKRMLSLLNNFLQTTVYESEQIEIPLENELHFINEYLEIEKIRFEDKLKIVQEIEPETLQTNVPSFLLQPVVENAIYHAIAHKTSNGIIRITASKEDHMVAITVEDNGPGLVGGLLQKRSKEGVGLKNTKDRLLHMYGENHSFQLEEISTGGVRVIIKVPFTLASSDRLEMYHSEAEKQKIV